MSDANFLILTQRWTPHSNGIKIMHKLCHTINDLGGNAKIMLLNDGWQPTALHDEGWINKNLKTPVVTNFDKKFINSSFVVYPETISGNPLGSQKVVRYLGNRESYCNGQRIGVGANDFIVAHSRMICGNAHDYLFNSEVNPVFHDQGTLPFNQRRMDATYIGKGYLYTQTQIIPNTLYIGREWPVGQEQLAILLRQTRYFFTWDAWTSTNTEAVLCGCVPIILNYAPWKPEELDAAELGWLPRGEIANEKLLFDEKKFMEGKAELITRISHYTSTWNARVGEFTDKVKVHFSKRYAS